MKNKKYWQRRYLQIKADELKSTADYEQALKKRMNFLKKQLQHETDNWLVRYANNELIDKDTASRMLKNIGTSNWTMTLQEFKRKAIAGGYEKELNSEYFKSRIARLHSLESQLDEISKGFAEIETKNMENSLAKQFDDTFMKNMYVIESQRLGYSTNFARFNEDQLKLVVSKPWKGSNFSKNVWKNYTESLPDQLMDSLLRSTILGESPVKAANRFAERFEHVRRSDIHRLIYTEMGHIAEQATSKAYEDSKIEKYEYLATLESHTCDVCARLDGKIFKLMEKIDGVNYPLIHPRCRCTTMPYIDELPDVTERWYRDPKTGKGKITKKLSFKEWEKQYRN